MKKIFIILIMYFQAFLSPVTAQLNPNNLVIYNELEGVFITDIITDKLGVVWIATNNGLVRYDGYEFKHYDQDPNDAKTIGSILTYKLFEAQNGHIWIGCTDLLSEYNPDTKTFKNYNLTGLTDFPKNERLDINAINENLSGRIYFGVYAYYGSVASHSIFYKDNNSEKLQRFDSPNKLEIKSVYGATTDPLGNIWVFANNGFFKIDNNNTIHKENWPLVEYLTNQYNSTIKSDAKGNIWMASSNANQLNLTVWNPKTGKYKSYTFLQKNEKNSYLFNEMEMDKKGNIWIGTNNGLLYFDLQKEQFQLLKENENQKRTNTGIFCIHLDSFDNLWMGTPTQGLLRYTNKAEFKSFVYKKEDKNSITSGWVSKIYENKQGKVWMVSNNGLDEFDPINNTLTPYPFDVIMPEFSNCGAVGQYSDKEILIRTNQGACLFNTNTKTYKKTTLDAKLEKIPLTNLKMDSRGNQWYCTPYGAFIKIKNKKTLQHIDLEKLPGSNIKSNLVGNIYESSKFGLWLITDNGLFLYHYDTEKVERFGFDKNKGDVLKSQDINSLYEDKDGILWVGTWGGGLNKYNLKTGKIKYYSIKDGLPSMNIQGILPDEKNKALWLSTFEGISRYSISEEQFNNFSMDDGIQGRSFADGSYLKTSNGLMIFGGSNGITVFNPNNISKNSMPPKVFITDLKIGDYSIFMDNDSLAKKTNNNENIVLQYNQNNLSIDYLGIQYTDPAKNKFAYKLENYDDNWHEVGNIRTAFYYNLPPGEYTFSVKAANSNGVWNETGASISFKITPPWWRTWWAYTIYGLLVLVIVFYLDKFQRKRLIQKEHEMAKELELEHARDIEKAYHKLKETQSQLIQSEKMASLGELTAGIAHEIQNPLNFVNNFSEVSSELLDELDEELNKGDIEEAKALSSDIKQNLEKINHHGKRADAIVKGMLQHSRSSSGVKEPTDINKLADEYLRLAYHGLRAKDKSFNATMITDFDESIGDINIIPQDIGRVILNLITNAFYAVNEKKVLRSLNKLETGSAQDDNYEPTVSISTKKVGDIVEISVKDNGNGIPQNVLDKIFQPFFTTKPTGQGTGLGLSLAYDIVKSHGGELKVETKVDKGTEFIITLP